MNTLLLLVIIYVVYRVILKLYYGYLFYKWNCGVPYQVDSEYLYKGFGFGKLPTQLRNMKNGVSADKTKEMYETHNVDTFETMSLGRSMIATINSENIKAVVSTQFNEFGIGSRKQILGAFLGDGIFVVEGHDWKTSRERLRPQFGREQISQIHAIEPHFQNFKEILLNQCTNDSKGYFDLQPLFFSLSFDISSEFLFSESVATLKPNNSTISRKYQKKEGLLIPFKCFRDILVIRGLLEDTVVYSILQATKERYRPFEILLMFMCKKY